MIAPGFRLGHLVVMERAGATAKNVIWRCRCDCGAVVEREAPALRPRGRFIGKNVSCGCTLPAHGHSASKANGGKASREYRAWHAMKQRCENPKAGKYSYYGGRGISVCPSWSASFEAFLADMGECPPGLTLDRFPDNNGDYEPGNVRWATMKQQSNNRRPKRSAEQMRAAGL